MKAYCAARFAAHPERQRAANQRWRAANPGRYNAQAKAYGEAHREQQRATTKAWYQANRARHLARGASWRAANREHHKALQATWLAANRERKAASARAWQHANRERIRAIAKAWRQANPGKRRATVLRRRRNIRLAGGHYTGAEWEALKARYDYRCLMCKRQEPDIRLTFDHVVPVSKGGTNDIGNGQPLCTSCNSHKHDKVLDLRT
jgi:5-methylcytosine-specific restriction endonuclease McrA